MTCGFVELRLEVETASVSSFEACPTGRPAGVVLSASRTRRKPDAEVVKAVAEPAIGGVAGVDRRSELAQLLLLTPLGVETFGPPTFMVLRSAR